MTTSKKDSTPPPLSRYQRVKNILNEAQGKVDVSYQGYGRFWELPLDKFLTTEIYGVRLIAEATDSPEADSDCDDCGCGCCDPAPKGASAAGLHPCKGRGAASGLIKGLRGEAPFDGSQFPKLLWGPSAKPINDADIQFIEDWIDDCCPENDEKASDEQKANTERKNLAYGHTKHKLTEQPVNAHKGIPGQLRVRKNINSLTPDELKRFRAAVAKMMCYDKTPQDERSFAYWAKMHADMCQHGWEQFQTWHRAYLYYFEQRLQDIDPTVTLPYWDWTDYAKQNMDAARANPPAPQKPQPVGQKQFSDDTGIIPDAYGCWMDDSGLANLKGKIADATWNKLAKVKDKLFLSGNRLYQAAGITYQGTGLPNGALTDDDKIMNELQRINPLWHRQRWSGMTPSLITHYPTPEDVERALQIPDFASWGSGPSSDHFYGALEQIHNFMHNFSGGANPNFVIGANPEFYDEPQYGHMVENRVTAYDPIFWGHHCNVDRLFARWQELHPGVNPQDTDSPLAPFEMDVAGTLSIQNLGYEYVEDTLHFPTDNSQGVVKFHSEAAPVQPHVLENARRVEIRLHKVQVLERAANIRVFVNQPNASVNTPTEGNDHYIGNYMSFAGFCYGGPGHCDVPQDIRRPFDHRMRHHKAPANLRFDATAAVQKLLETHDGRKSLPLSVHLVVTDFHGHENENVLKLDGVSINFV